MLLNLQHGEPSSIVSALPEHSLRLSDWQIPGTTFSPLLPFPMHFGQKAVESHGLPHSPLPSPWDILSLCNIQLKVFSG